MPGRAAPAAPCLTTQIRGSRRGGKPGPTLALVRDLKALYRDVEDPRYKLSFAEQHIAIGVALGNAEMAGAKTYAERALIYHALGFRVVG